MDLGDPTRAVTATLDGPVLAALARAGKPLTAGEIAAQTARGSEIGVRRSLSRLAEQGIVRVTEMGRNRVHELNREHVAAPIAEALAGLRLELWGRLRRAVGSWQPKPVFGCVFGSAARGDGSIGSDIDLLLVHTPIVATSYQVARSVTNSALVSLSAQSNSNGSATPNPSGGTSAALGSSKAAKVATTATTEIAATAHAAERRELNGRPLPR